jgi:glycosyltransferase involved in cell wall biosynthesis
VSESLSIVHLVAPGAAGGLESVVRLLAMGHARRGHAVHVAAVLPADAPDEHPWLSPLRAGGIDVVPIRVGGRAYLRERAEVGALCRRLNPSVVHSHGYRPDVVGAGAARAAGVPIVTTVHGFTGVGGWKGRIYESLQVRALRRFDAVIAVSRPLAARLAASGVRPERLHAIPNAYAAGDPRLDRPAARRALGLPDDATVVGWVGRLSREKGADVLLDAVARRQSATRVVVSFVGDGREREALAAQAARLGIADRVRFHGMVSDAARLLAAFDVLALSSRTEGTPIVLFEAMAAGVPIVASRVGGVPDVVTGAEAALVPPEQPEALARALEEVLVHDRAGARARARAAEVRLHDRYALDPWLERHETLYRSLHTRRSR